MLNNKDLLSINELSENEIISIINNANNYYHYNKITAKKKVLNNFTQINLFFENSTRTQVSFEIAGTLLGAVRDGKFIPWDHDVDLGIIYKNQEEINQLILSLKKNYYVRALKFKNDPDVWNLGEYRIIKVYNKKGVLDRQELGLDIFIFYLSTLDNKKDKVYKYGVWGKNAFYPENLLSEFSTLSFYGRVYSVPKNINQFLKFKYGEDWKTPKKNWSTVLNDKSLIKNNKYHDK